jgi:uncharacterized protein
MVRQLLLVMKITKFCNLRCSYCYEYKELANKAVMPLQTIAAIFRTIGDYLESAGQSQEAAVSFLWHGGEPFLVPLELYQRIGDLQRDILGRVKVRNYVQTNLTVLTERQLRFLKDREFFSGLGVSFDVYGDQRVGLKGKSKTEIILSNMQKLIDNGIRFGAITVLAKNTAPHVEKIYHFFDKLGIPSRFLPFYLNAFDAQVGEHELDHDELVECLIRIFRAWFSSPSATRVAPIREYLEYAAAFHVGQNMKFYEKRDDQFVFIVNTDGTICGADEIYVDQGGYGDLTTSSFEMALQSPNRIFSIQNAEKRRDRYCLACPYYGFCPGSFVQDASPQQQRILEKSGCPVRAVLDHIIPVVGDVVPWEGHRT